MLFMKGIFLVYFDVIVEFYFYECDVKLLFFFEEGVEERCYVDFFILIILICRIVLFILVFFYITIRKILIFIIYIEMK